jgi:hypothetical protein
MTEVNAEMAKLTKGIEKNNKELQSLPSLEKRVKEMAAEITGIIFLFSLFCLTSNETCSIVTR